MTLPENTQSFSSNPDANARRNNCILIITLICLDQFIGITKKNGNKKLRCKRTTSLGSLLSMPLGRLAQVGFSFVQNPAQASAEERAEKPTC